MPIIIDPATGARRFVADNSGFNVAPLLTKTPATTEAGEFAKGLRSGIEQVKGLGNSALAAGAAVVGADEFSEEQSAQANENFRRAGEIGPRVTDFNTATESTENFTDFLKGGLGQAVPTFAVAAGGGVAGLGVKSLLKSGVSKTVAGGGGAFAATEGLETGGIFSGLVNDPVARENKTLGELAGISFAGAAPAAALDTLPLMRAARKFGLGLSARRELTSKMKEFGKGVTSQALIEGSTEGAQTVIERATHNFVNKHFEILGEEGINEILGAATIGTAFGGITGGAAVAPGILGSRMAELDRETQNNVSQAEATFDKLRKVDDEVVQEHLDYLQDFNVEDAEVQEDLDAMLKDLNLRRPKFQRNVEDNVDVQAAQEQIEFLQKSLRERYGTPDGKGIVNTPEARKFLGFVDHQTRQFLNLKTRVSNARDGKVESNKFQSTAPKASRGKFAEFGYKTIEERVKAGETIPPPTTRAKPPAPDPTAKPPTEFGENEGFAHPDPGVRASDLLDDIRTGIDKNNALPEFEKPKKVLITDTKKAKAKVAAYRKKVFTGMISLAKPDVKIDASLAAKLITAAQDKNTDSVELRKVFDQFFTDPTRVLGLINDSSADSVDAQTLSNDEFSELTLKDTNAFITEDLTVVGDERADAAFSDQIKGTTLVKTGLEHAKDRQAKLEAANPGFLYHPVDAFDAFAEQADRSFRAGEVATSRGDEIIRLAQDDNLRMRRNAVSKSVDPASIDTVEKVKTHLQGRTLLVREKIPSLFDGIDKESLTKADLSNDLSTARIASRARARGNISLRKEKTLEDGTGIDQLQADLKAVKEIEKAIEIPGGIRNRDALEIAKGQRVEFTQDPKKNRILLLNAVYDERFALEQLIKETDIGKGEAQGKRLDDELNAIRKNTITRTEKGLGKEGEAFFKKLLTPENVLKKIPTVADYKTLRNIDPTSRYIVFGEDANTGTFVAIRPHAIIQKNFQKLFGGQGRAYDKETIQIAWMRGLSDLIVDHEIIIYDNSMTNDVIVFTDASKKPWTIGELGSVSTGRSLAQAKRSIEILIAREEADTKPKPEKIATLKVRLLEITRSQAIADKVEREAAAHVKKFIKNSADITRLAKKKRALENTVQKYKRALIALLDSKDKALNKDYIDQQIHRTLLESHKEAEEGALQRQLLIAQNMEVAKLRDIFNRSALFNDNEFAPIPLKEFEKLVGTPGTKAGKAQPAVKAVKAVEATKTTKAIEAVEARSAQRARKETKATGLLAENDARIRIIESELARLDNSSQRFDFIMETTSNDPSISMSAAEVLHDQAKAVQQSLIEEAVADRKTLVAMASRYKKEMTRLEASSKLRLRTINDQIKQHQKFLTKHEAAFKENERAIQNYTSATAALRTLNEKISTKNTAYNFSLKALRAIEKIEKGGPDLSITNMLNDISPTLLNREDFDSRRKDKQSPKLIAEIGVHPDEFKARAKDVNEEALGFEPDKKNITHFASAGERSAYTRIQSEIQEIQALLDEADLTGSKKANELANRLKAKMLGLKSFHARREDTELRPITLDEQTVKGESDKTRRNQKAAKNVAGFKKGFEFGKDTSREEAKVILTIAGKRALKPIVAAVKQIAGRIKTTAGVLSTEQAMEAFNMTRQQLLETNGMYFKGQIWVKETLNPAVMREVIAHELGHGVFQNELRTASVQIQNNIRKEFDAWRESIRGKSVHSVIQSKTAFNTARKYITESKDRALSTLSTEDQKYLLDFEEWFADQVSIYEGTKPTTALGKFFAKIGNLIKKLMGRQTQSSVREFLDSIEQRNWVPSAIDRGHRFFEYAKASKAISDDSLIGHLVRKAGNSMADIETLSNMLPKMFTKADLALLGRAFTQGNVRSQLFRLYPPKALEAFDNSVSRTVAAGLIQWAHGDLQVGPKVHSVYEKATGKVANALKGKTDMQKQNAALDAIKQGKVIWGHISDLKLTNMRTDAKKFKDVENIADFMQSIGDVFEKVFISASDRLYGTKNPALIRLAQMFHSRSGSRLIKQGYFQEKQRNIGRYLSSASNVLKPLSDEQKAKVLQDLRSGKLTSNEAKGMRKIYNAMYAYATNNGVDLKLRQNYVPRVWNKEEVANRRQELEALLGQHGIKETETAVDRLLGMEEREIEEWIIPYIPSAPATKQRGLGGVPDQILADAGFLSNDLEYVTANYIEALVKRVEYTKRFGEGSDKIIEITQDAEKMGATTADIELMHSYIQAMMGITGHETNAALAKLLGLKAPPTEQKINPVIQQALSTVLVVRNLALLSLAMFTSLADPLGISVRSGSLRDTGVALKTGMQEIWNSVTGQQSSVHELANALGILESHMTNVALQWEYGSTYMAPWARRINDEFFKWTGLTGLTRLTRSMALGASHSFIARHASNPNESSLRYLEELNLTPEEVWLTPDGKSVRILTFEERSKAAQHERDRDDKVRAAMNQFVDESILRPNAAQRPIWASDPHYMLVFHLKSFMYSFHDRILRRAVTEMGQHNQVAPMVGLMMFIPALLFIDSLRDLIKHGGTPSYKQNWDMSDYAFNSMERAGLFGIYQQGFDIKQAQQYGGTGAEALLGGVMFPFQLFTDPAELLPFQNLRTK